MLIEIKNQLIKINFWAKTWARRLKWIPHNKHYCKAISPPSSGSGRLLSSVHLHFLSHPFNTKTLLQPLYFIKLFNNPLSLFTSYVMLLRIKTARTKKKKKKLGFHFISPICSSNTQIIFTLIPPFKALIHVGPPFTLFLCWVLPFLMIPNALLLSLFVCPIFRFLISSP